jgi:hypothetical protein
MKTLRTWVLLGLASVVVLIGPPASATCIAVPFARELRSSDSVWWATVVGARTISPKPTKDNPQGFEAARWELTVVVHQVLKGPRPHVVVSASGVVARVVTGSCGPPTSYRNIRASAAAFPGLTSLFIGDQRGGVLYRSLDVTDGPQAAHDQYELALAALGVSAPTSRVWEFAVVTGIALAIAALGVVARRRRQRVE